MKKIPSLFVRDYENPGIIFKRATMNPDDKPIKGAFLAKDVVTPGCEWVINGEGIATRKWDGTAVLFMEGLWFKRYDAKHGKMPPPDFFEAQPEPDPITGHWPGWVPVSYVNPADKFILEAIANWQDDGYLLTDIRSGTTFEAIGPKINGNKDRWDEHYLQEHGECLILLPPERSFNGIKQSLEMYNTHIEGIVFHHPDGRMCKVKRSDFGLKW